MFGGDSHVYSGPDRRDPRAFDLGRRRWPAAAALLTPAAVLLIGELGNGAGAAVDSLALALGLSAGVLFLAAWRVAGRVPDAMVGLGACLSAPTLTRSDTDWFDLLLLACAAVALVCALRAPQVTAAMRPLQAVVLVGGALTLVGLAATRVPGLALGNASSATGAAVAAVCWVTLACAFAARARALPRPKAHRLASAFLLLGLAHTLIALDAGAALVPALLVSGTSIVATTAIANLAGAMRRQDERAGRLRRRLHRTELSEHRQRELLHDARTALACIRSAHTTLARYHGALAPSDRSQLEQAVRAELDRLARLLDRDGRAPVRTQPFDVLATLRPLVVSYHQRGLDVVLRGRPATAAGDPDGLVEIVSNLLDNTLKHAGGAPATITVDESPSGLHVSVTDTGPGIPPHLRDTIFRPGSRGDHRGVPGEGLGLAVAHQLAQAQGGSLELIDAPDGAWFVIRLQSASGPLDAPSRSTAALDGS